jgi:uncharacterized membrane protein
VDNIATYVVIHFPFSFSFSFILTFGFELLIAVTEEYGFSGL